MNASIDLDLVTRFVRVAEARSFAAAASRAGVPKSTLSRSVARLEEALGVRLMERTTRSLRLTDEGQQLFDRARTSLAHLEEALELTTDAPRLVRGTLRISAPPDLGEPILADLLGAFLRAHPEVRVDVEFSNRVVDLVKEGFDAALRGGSLRDSTLVARKLMDTDFGLFAAPTYLAAHGTPRRARDLERHETVLFRPQHSEARVTLRSSRGSERVKLYGRLASDDLGFVRSAVLRGMGIGALPVFGVEDALGDGRLVRVLEGFTAGGGALYLVYPSSRLAPARLVAFRDFATAHFARGCAEAPHQRRRGE